MGSKLHKYLYETFEADSDEFDRKFSAYMDVKHTVGWKHHDCIVESNGTKEGAACLFRRD